LIIVKVGGAAGIDYDRLCDDVASLWREQTALVLVHGGSSFTDELSTRLGHPPRYVTSASGFVSRFTDRETLEIFEMVYCGKMNKGIVERLQRRGVNAVGLSGLDGRILEGPRKDTLKIVEQGKRKVLRGDHTGRVERVNAALIELLLAHAYLPVLTPPAASFEGEAINVDGDRAAAMLGAALRADTVLFLSNVPGLLRDVDDETSVIEKLRFDALDRAMNDVARGRMKKKVMGASEALAAGVQRCIFGDARIERPIRSALAGRGTVIER
jgi:acetylglutamate/LysW-gamma-L-alpha-aminoadipate kinase